MSRTHTSNNYLLFFRYFFFRYSTNFSGAFEVKARRFFDRFEFPHVGKKDRKENKPIMQYIIVRHMIAIFPFVKRDLVICRNLIKSSRRSESSIYCRCSHTNTLLHGEYIENTESNRNARVNFRNMRTFSEKRDT